MSRYLEDRPVNARGQLDQAALERMAERCAARPASGVAPFYESPQGRVEIAESDEGGAVTNISQTYYNSSIVIGPQATLTIGPDPLAQASGAGTLTLGGGAVNVTANTVIGSATNAIYNFPVTIYAPLTFGVSPVFLAGVTLPASALPALAGDVTSAAGTAVATVTGIQGYPVAGTAPTNGQVLQWNSSANDYAPTTLSSSSVFVGAGTGHAPGLVPDPGATAHPNDVFVLRDSAQFQWARGWLKGTSVVNTSETTVSTVAADLATVQSISVTLDTVQSLFVEVNAVASPSAISSSATLYVTVDGTPNAVCVLSLGAVGSTYQMCGAYLAVALAAGAHTITLQFSTTVPDTCTFSYRRLSVQQS